MSPTPDPPATISAPVGLGGANRRDDVLVVQHLLFVNWDRLRPFPPPERTGACDRATTDAIGLFQMRALGVDAPNYRVDPDSLTLDALHRHEDTPRTRERVVVRHALRLLEGEAVDFAARHIKDARVRGGYVADTRDLCRRLMSEYALKEIAAPEAAEQAVRLRNELLDAARLTAGDIAAAFARRHRLQAAGLAELADGYARHKYGEPFGRLTRAARDEVCLGVVQAAGRPHPTPATGAKRSAVLGRGLAVVAVAVAVYNVLTADDTTRALVGGGAPAAVGAFVGGVLAAMGAGSLFRWLTD
jgi:hypothetical protein